MLMKRPMRPLSSNLTKPATLANRVSSLPRPTLTPGLYLVPRWRTRMEPPLTNWPPKRFTPSRWPWESRPLTEEPPPFLCAIEGTSEFDFAYLDGSEVLAMATLDLVLAACLVFQHAEFGSPDLPQDAAGDTGLRRGTPGDHFVVGAHGKHVAEFDGVTGFAGQRFHFKPVARGDTVLLPSGANQGIHGASRGESETNII